MTSAERKEIVVRAVEGGLFDEVWDRVMADEQAEGPEAVRACRERIREVLQERPRQTKRLMRAAVAALWRRHGLGDPEKLLDPEAWREMDCSLEGKL